MLENRDAVVAPERFAVEEEYRHAEDVVGGGLVLSALIGGGAFTRKKFAIVGGGHAETCDYVRDRAGLVGLEFAAKEHLVNSAAVVEQASLLLREEAADQRRRRVVNFQRPANHQTARLGPSARVEIRVPRLVFGVETALALALDSKLERNPSDANAKSIFEREGGIECEVGERTLVVRVHLNFVGLHEIDFAARDFLRSGPRAFAVSSDGPIRGRRFPDDRCCNASRATHAGSSRIARPARRPLPGCATRWCRRRAGGPSSSCGSRP